jgi:hypothetical protein
MANAGMPAWLTTAEAAAELRKTPETLVNWVMCNRIPGYAWLALPKGYLFRSSWVADPIFTTARARTPQSGVAGKCD